MLTRLHHELRLFLVAVQFFTRVPVPAWVGFSPAWLQASARHFPGVGLCVGVVGAVVLAGASGLTSPTVAVLLSMMATVVLTGAFHEDGLADTCDALGGHVSRARALEIMKDSRIGSYGTVGLVLVLGLKAALLASLPLALAVPALIFGHTVSRGAAVVLLRTLPYAGDTDQSKAKPLATGVSSGGLLAALGWVAFTAAAMAAWQFAWAVPLLLSTALAAAGTWACRRWWLGRLGGFTGDTLGATQQLTECLALLGWLVWLRAMGWGA